MWTGEHPFDGTPLEVQDGLPEEGGRMADPPAELKQIVDRLLKNR